MPHNFTALANSILKSSLADLHAYGWGDIKGWWVDELYCHTPAKSWVGCIIGFDADLVDIGFGTELPVFGVCGPLYLGHVAFGVMLSKHSAHMGV